MVQRALGWAVMVVSLMAISCKGDKAQAGRSKIAVIPKGTAHEFWKSVHAGAEKAAGELSIDVVWKGPLQEDDLKAQIDVVQSFIAQGVSGIVLAPLSDKGLANAVAQAKGSKIDTVVFDSDLKGGDYVSFVATDNFAAGQIAGEEMARLLSGKGNVVMLRYQEGSASTTNREDGFLAAIKKSPGVRVVSENQFAGATTESAHDKSENLLAANKASAGGIDGVFCPNESTTFGMLLALEKEGLAGKLKFIGFDSSAKLIDGLRRGHIDGLVVQNPMNMGYLAVKTMVQHMRGENVEKRIDTGAALLTTKNLDDPAMKEIVSPDIKKWLKE